MSRRLGRVGIIMIVLFVVLAGQTAYLQYWHASALNNSPQNPRLTSASQRFPRGEIVAADGTVLAYSIPSGNSQYPYRRVYPQGSLTAGVVGFSSNFYGQWALEAQYNPELVASKQPAQSWADVLAPKYASNSVTLTLQPALQRVARTALAGRDGAVVELDPRTGAILAMYSNPNYNDNMITASTYFTEKQAWLSYNKNDYERFPPLGLLATQQTFPPGSTFKVVTTASVVSGRPDLLTKSYKKVACFVPPTGNPLKPLCNDGGSQCGGTISVMLPESCDPGYALVGLDVGGDLLSRVAGSFGFNQSPPIDLPGVVNSYFPSAAILANDIPQLAYSAIGQENVHATALQNALVAAAIANGGTIMTPHLLDNIIGPYGTVVRRYTPTKWLSPLTLNQASQIVPFMENVVRHGTASGVGFPYADDVAAKTGTAQTGNALNNTDDWMIAFAPATNPVMAIAVVVPYQAISAYGATIAGPIVKCMVEATLALNQGQPTSGTSSTC